MGFQLYICQRVRSHPATSRWSRGAYNSTPASITRCYLANGKVVGEERLLQDREQRVRDVRQGPDGLLYLLTDSPEGELIRLRP